MKYHRSIFIFLFLLLLIGWIVLLQYLSPTGVVEAIGVRNGYIVSFVTAFLGGLSIFTSVPYTFVVITLAVGGLNPILLGLSAGAGLILGDITLYLIGYHGRRVFSERVQVAFFDPFRMWLFKRNHRWAVPLAVFLYGAFIPFSNDIVVISFGLARYPFWKLMIPLGIGSVIFNTWVAFVGAYGVDFLTQVFM